MMEYPTFLISVYVATYPSILSFVVVMPINVERAFKRVVGPHVYTKREVMEFAHTPGVNIHFCVAHSEVDWKEL